MRNKMNLVSILSTSKQVVILEDSGIIKVADVIRILRASIMIDPCSIVGVGNHEGMLTVVFGDEAHIRTYGKQIARLWSALDNDFIVPAYTDKYGNIIEKEWIYA